MDVQYIFNINYFNNFKMWSLYLQNFDTFLA